MMCKPSKARERSTANHEKESYLEVTQMKENLEIEKLLIWDLIKMTQLCAQKEKLRRK